MLIAFFAINMGTGEQTSTMPSPEFVSLEEDQRSFAVEVYDKGRTTKVYDFSFSGNTDLAGVKREGSDAVITLDISEIKKIIIDQSAHKTKEFQHPKFTSASVEFATGVKKNGFLIPEDVVVCGIETETKTKSAWFLSDLEKIVVLKERIAADVIKEKQKKTKDEKGIWQKTKDTIKDVTKKISG